jgi:hypothetical protein
MRGGRRGRGADDVSDDEGRRRKKNDDDDEAAFICREPESRAPCGAAPPLSPRARPRGSRRRSCDPEAATAATARTTRSPWRRPGVTPTTSEKFLRPRHDATRRLRCDSSVCC